MHRQDSIALGFLGAALVAGGIIAACTPEQRAPLRTALDVNLCVNAIVIRHIDAGDDLKTPAQLGLLSAEIASECSPRLAGKDGG